MKLKTQINGKIFHTHELEELILLKYPDYLKQSTSQCNSYQNSNDIFHRNRTILKFEWNCRRPWKAKAILRKKNKAAGITLPDFKLYYKVIVVKIVLAWKETHRSMKQNREPRNKLTQRWSINLWQRRQVYTMGMDSFFNKWCWENWTAACKRMNLDHYLKPFTKINSKWVKDLNIRPETIKHLEGNRQ